jgi:hypothetical protein
VTGPDDGRAPLASEPHLNGRARRQHAGRGIDQCGSGEGAGNRNGIDASAPTISHTDHATVGIGQARSRGHGRSPSP